MKYYLLAGIIFSIYTIKIAHHIPLKLFVANIISCLIVAVAWPVVVVVVAFKRLKN
jgi:hypothetical protein